MWGVEYDSQGKPTQSNAVAFAERQLAGEQPDDAVMVPYGVDCFESF